MRFLLFKLLLCSSLSAHATPAKLIGFSALSDKIFSRVFVSTTPTKTWNVLDLYFFPNTPLSFANQLGHYDAASYAIKNGDPNSYNMILLGVLIDTISQQLSESCSATTMGLQLQKDLQTALAKLCSWPALSAVDENVLVEFFHQVTLFDYSFDEKQAWLTHFQHPDMLKKTASEVIYEMTFTLMMNPHYLLKK